MGLLCYSCKPKNANFEFLYCIGNVFYYRATSIAEVYKDYDSENAEEIQEKILTYLEMTTGIETVCVIGEENEKIWSSNNQYPDITNISEIDLQDSNIGTNVRMIVEEDKSEIFEIEGDEIIVNDKIVEKIVGNINVFDALFTEGTESIMGMKIWFSMPVNQIEVFVLYDVQVYSQDMFMLLVSTALMIFVVSVFAMYYIISFIGVVVSMRRTDRILYTDMITGGENWLYFVKKGTSYLKKNRNNKRNYAMVHLRMYKYRSFCTCFGVKEGEELLEKFYGALKKQMQRREVMAYHENAEFGLLITYTDEAQLAERIESMRKTLNATLPEMKFYFGFGICKIEAGEKDVEQLYNNAIIACDLLGEDNDNQVAYFDVEMNKQKLWERKVEDEMERALRNHEFQVYLQAKINTSHEELAGAEALVRWLHPTDGLIPPFKFIPIFEKNGFILKLDDYMLEEIAKLQAQWISEGRKVVPISVNVSRAHFTREDLAEHICEVVDKYNVPHNVIELELTESAFFDDKKTILNTVKKLREYGFVVSMDDFGAGYSSLNSLKELQLDVLKIDADFFRGDNVEERGMLIVSEVIGLAKKLNMKIVAEGIESREQVDFLVEQECDLIQGYFYAKPMSVEDYIEKYYKLKD